MTKINYIKCLEGGINFWTLNSRLHYNHELISAKSLYVGGFKKKTVFMFSFTKTFPYQTDGEINLVNYFLNMKENERPLIPMC